MGLAARGELSGSPSDARRTEGAGTPVQRQHQRRIRRDALPVPLLSYVEVLLMPQTRERGWGPAIEGQVVRHTEAGLGLEWCELAPRAIRMPGLASLYWAPHKPNLPP